MYQLYLVECPVFGNQVSRWLEGPNLVHDSASPTLASKTGFRAVSFVADAEIRDILRADYIARPDVSRSNDSRNNQRSNFSRDLSLSFPLEDKISVGLLTDNLDGDSVV